MLLTDTQRIPQSLLSEVDRPPKACPETEVEVNSGLSVPHSEASFKRDWELEKVASTFNATLFLAYEYV